MSEVWFQTNIRVQYQETDQMGVVHHGKYVNWFEIGRTEWMRQYGMVYRKMEELGLLLPVLDMNVQYKKSALYDNCIGIFAKVGNFSPVRLEFIYEIRRIKEDEFEKQGEVQEPFGELLASGSTMHMWVNSKWKPSRLDKAAPDMYQILQEHRKN